MTSLLSTGLKIAGSVISGNKRKKASKRAEAAQIAAQERADALAREGNAQIQTNLTPYNETGQIGLRDLSQNFDQYHHNFSQEDFQTDPGYEWRLAEGQRALDRTANAHGGVFSGRQLEATTNYGQMMAMNEYDRARQRFNEDRDSAYNKSLGIAGIGERAVAGSNAAISNMTNQATSAQLGIGTAQANGALERGLIGAQTWTSAINDAVSAVEGSKGLASMFAGLGG